MSEKKKHPIISRADAFIQYNRHLVSKAIQWFGPDEADDAVSRTWLEAMKFWDNWRGDAARKSWIFSILRYEWYEWLHGKVKRRLHSPIEKATHIQGSTNNARAVERLDLLQKILGSMSARDRKSLLDWSVGIKVTRNITHRAVLSARIIAEKLAKKPFHKTIRILSKVKLKGVIRRK